MKIDWLCVDNACVYINKLTRLMELHMSDKLENPQEEVGSTTSNNKEATTSGNKDTTSKHKEDMQANLVARYFMFANQKPHVTGHSQ